MAHPNQVDFIERIKSELSTTIDAIHNHEYIDALDKYEIRKEKLQIFVFEQYHIIANDRRNFALMISKASNDIASVLFTDCLNAEIDALKNLSAMAKELNIDDRKIDYYQPLAGCQAYTNYLTRLAMYGSDAEILSALLIDLPVWGNNCGKISYILQENYGFTRKSCKFLDNFAIPLPEDFISKSKELIMSSINDSPLNEKKIRIATRMIIDYELTFWDTIYKHSIMKQ